MVKTRRFIMQIERIVIKLSLIQTRSLCIILTSTIRTEIIMNRDDAFLRENGLNIDALNSMLFNGFFVQFIYLCSNFSKALLIKTKQKT
jgi:hypothetical protein